MLKLNTVKHRPQAIALWIAAYLQQQHQQNHLETNMLLEMRSLLSNLVEGLTSCERISKTPIPVAYAVYLKRLILIYCICLPFGLVDNLHWWASPIVALISFILLGVEAIGGGIEDPFGYGLNDLPLDELCNMILDNVEEVVAFTPSDRSQEIILPITSPELSPVTLDQSRVDITP